MIKFYYLFPDASAAMATEANVLDGGDGGHHSGVKEESNGVLIYDHQSRQRPRIPTPLRHHVPRSFHSCLLLPS
jgi:hypothetical protein